MAGPRERDGQPPRAGAELEDRSACPGGQREVEVEVARILDEVEVVQAGQRRGLGRSLLPGSLRAGDGQPFPRTRRPAAFFTASAPIASSTARFAAIAVTSA